MITDIRGGTKCNKVDVFCIFGIDHDLFKTEGSFATSISYLNLRLSMIVFTIVDFLNWWTAI
jgi:hypothetical protein